MLDELHAAVAVDDVSKVARLISRGADINGYHQKRGTTPLISAACVGRIDIVRLLIRRGADLNRVDRGAGETAVGHAACFGHHEVLQLLLKAGAKADHCSANCEYTALMHAVANGHRASATMLLVAGADPRFETAPGWSAISIAERYGHDALRHTLTLQVADKARTRPRLDMQSGPARVSVNPRREIADHG